MFVAALCRLDNYISLTSSRLSSMAPGTQANLLSSLAVWNAKLSPAWLAMFQLLVVKQAEEGSMKLDELEQVCVGCLGWRLVCGSATNSRQHF
jgi:hypothetical protein